MSGLNTEEIIQLAREADLLTTTEPNGYQVWIPENLERFANLVAAAEREAICAFLARVVDEYENMDRQGSAEDIRKFIRRIRARGTDAA